MATLRELVYNVKNIIRGGRQSDDEPISDRQVAYIIKNVRAKLTRMAILNKITLANSDQDLGCVKLVQVDKSECCEIKTECFILRTEKKIPALLEGDKSLLYVGLVDKQRGFEFTSYAQVAWKKYSRWTSFVPMAFWRNDYIYVTNLELLEYVNILGIFEDPEKVKEFDTCNRCKDFSWDDQYPMETWLINDLERDIIQTEIRMAAMTPQDTKNESRKDPNMGTSQE